MKMDRCTLTKLCVFTVLMFAFAKGQACCPSVLLTGNSTAPTCTMDCIEGLEILNYDCSAIPSASKLKLMSLQLPIKVIKENFKLVNVTNCKSVLEFDNLESIDGYFKIDNVDLLESTFKSIKSITPTSLPCDSTSEDFSQVKGLTNATKSHLQQMIQKGKNECLAKFATTPEAPGAKSGSAKDSGGSADTQAIIGTSVGVAVTIGLVGSVVAGIVVWFLFFRKGKKARDLEMGSIDKTMSGEAVTKTKSTSSDTNTLPPQFYEEPKKEPRKPRKAKKKAKKVAKKKREKMASSLSVKTSPTSSADSVLKSNESKVGSVSSNGLKSKESAASRVGSVGRNGNSASMSTAMNTARSESRGRSTGPAEQESQEESVQVETKAKQEQHLLKFVDEMVEKRHR